MLPAFFAPRVVWRVPAVFVILPLVVLGVEDPARLVGSCRIAPCKCQSRQVGQSLRGPPSDRRDCRIARRASWSGPGFESGGGAPVSLDWSESLLGAITACRLALYPAEARQLTVSDGGRLIALDGVDWVRLETKITIVGWSHGCVGAWATAVWVPGPRRRRIRWSGTIGGLNGAIVHGVSQIYAVREFKHNIQQDQPKRPTGVSLFPSHVPLSNSNIDCETILSSLSSPSHALFSLLSLSPQARELLSNCLLH